MTATPFLLDGPLMTAIERKRLVTEKMASDLLKDDTILNREEAVRTLRTAGYSIFDVDLLVDDARAVAFQEIVAKVMSEPEVGPDPLMYDFHPDERR